MKWSQFDNISQIYLYWEYCSANPETNISFLDFSEMMEDIMQDDSRSR